MYVELHILQNFAPSNLNRDDTNSPKDCEFGGYRRARISSQCLKRAIRTFFQQETEFRQGPLMDPEHRASRTKRLHEALGDYLVRQGHPSEEARAVATKAIEWMGVGFNKEKTKTDVLLFLGEAEIKGLAALVHQHWTELSAAVQAAAQEAESGKASVGKEKKSAKQDENAKKQAEIGKAFQAVLDGGKAADLALFGRMVAVLPERKVDAASQVAHALSTNRVSMEFDFYTAVDDLKPEDTAGADMLGTVEFNSACFYRYANVDVNTLIGNLGGDAALARETVRAFLIASVLAIPTGKQNSMAAQNPPSFLLAVVRERGLWSLANAFLKPVAPGSDGDLMEKSIRALDSYWGKVTRMYGTRSLTGHWAVNLDGNELASFGKDAVVADVDTLVDRVVMAALPDGTAQ